MSNDLSDHRKSYDKFELLEKNCPKHPITLFKDWFSFADTSDLVDEANAMSISTIGKDGFPKNRIVLLKKYDENGFVFYTNYNSEKGKAIAENKHVCLSFFWPALEKQIIIKGIAEKVSEEMSESYFMSRPDGSKMGAWASHQSEVVDSREALDDNLKKIEEEFKNSKIIRPKHWGGYRVKPISIEFWQGRPNRMHDRIRYVLQKEITWKLERLAP